MAMIVKHNLQAMNSNRMLGITAGSQAKSTEKLSSGYKINRAADDAAGLSISEKMRKQIRGLTQASLNAQDGISAVQTAEGAMNEVQDMLQRMNELAVKAANGTNSEDDRSYIQDEVDQLIEEINRVSTTTKFNETYLLKGKEGATTYTASYKDEISSVPAVADGKTVGDGGDLKLFAKGSTTAITEDQLDQYFEVNDDGEVVLKEGVVLYTVAADDAGEFGAQVEEKIADETDWADIIVAESNALLDGDGGNIVTDLSSYFDENGNYLGGLFKTDSNGDDQEVGAEQIADYVTVTEEVAEAPLTLSLHVGADGEDSNKITLDIQSMSAKSIGVDQIDVTTEGNATLAIETLESAIQQVSTQRSALGAVQNRLEHTIANLDNVVENTTAAEAQIRDTDMATEMVKYSNNNILAQAGQAMLAQANQANQGVLSLLG